MFLNRKLAFTGLTAGVLLSAAVFPLKAVAFTSAWAPYPPAVANHPGGGPWGGRINDLAIEYDGSGNINRMFAATKGGLFKYDNLKNHWFESDAGFVSSKATSVDICIQSPNYLIASVSAPASSDPLQDSGGGVYLSSDYGDSWTRVDPSKFENNYETPHNFMAVAIDPADPTHLFVAANDEAKYGSSDRDVIFESVDGGVTWLINPGTIDAAPKIELSNVYNTARLEIDVDGTLYMHGQTPTIYRYKRNAISVEALSTPSDLSACAVKDFALVDGSPRNLFVAAGACGLWKGVENGPGASEWSWTKLQSAPTVADGVPEVLSVGVFPANPLRVYYSVYDFFRVAPSQVYESLDGGFTSSPVTLPEKQMNITDIVVDANGTTVSEFNSGLFRRGLTGNFAHSSVGLNAHEANQFDFNPTGSGSATGGNEMAVSGGNLTSGNGNGGVSIWTPSVGWSRASDNGYAQGSATRMITYATANKLWLSVEGFNIYAGERGNSLLPFNWTEKTIGIGTDSTSLNSVLSLTFAPDPADPNYQDKAVLCTSNLIMGKGRVPYYDPALSDVRWYEEGWNNPGNMPSGWRNWSGWLAQADPFVGGGFYIVSGRAAVGSGVGTNIGYFNYAWMPSSLSLVDVYAPIYSYISSMPDVTVQSLAASTSFDGQLYAGTYENGLLKSTDAAASWTQVSLPGAGATPDVPHVALGTVENDNLVAAYVTGKGFYVTGNAGAEWRLINGGLDFPGGIPEVTSMKFTPDNGALVAGFRGRGLWSLHVGSPPIITVNGATTTPLGTTIVLDAVASDADGDSLTVSSTLLPDGPTISGSHPSWTADNTPPELATVGNRYVVAGQTLSFNVTAVDLIPEATFQISASDGFFTTKKDVTLSATGASVGTPTITASGSILNSGYANKASFDGQTFTWTPVAGESGQNFTVTFTATDVLGATDSETVTINVNRTPAVTLSAELIFTTETVTSQSFSISDPDGDAVTLSATGMPSWLSLNGANPSFDGTAPTADGGLSYVVTLTATDEHGASSQKQTTISVNRPPVLSPIGSKYIGLDETEVFAVSATDADSDSVVITVEPLPATASFDGHTFVWVPSATDKGDWVLAFTATDAHGGTDTELVTVTVEGKANHPPVLGLIGSRFVNSGSTLTIPLGATDVDGDTLYYHVEPAPPLPQPAGSTFSWTPGDADAGIINATFTVCDRPDNCDSSDSEAITIEVNRAPVLTLPGVQNGVVGQQIAFAVAATDPEGDQLHGDALGLPYGATFDGAGFSWIPSSDQVGGHTITFTFYDSHSAKSQGQVTINVTAPNNPPVLSPVGNRSYAFSNMPPIQLVASDPDGDALTYGAVSMKINGMDVNPTLGPGTGILLDPAANPPTFTLTSNFIGYASGYISAFPFTFEVTFVVTDTSGASDSETIAIEINQSAPPDLPPVTIALGAQNGVVGRTLSFEVSATDPNGQTVTITAQNLPAGSAFDGKTFIWTPTLSDWSAAHTPLVITFIATDSSSNTAQMDVPITVYAAPQLGSLSGGTVAVGQTMAFNVSASDADGEEITLSAGGLPTGASFNAATGAFSWSPSGSGTHPVRFTASDWLASDSATIELIAFNPPSVEAISDQYVTVGSQLSFSVNATDLDFDIESLTMSGNPAGAVLANGRFIWTPAAGDGGQSHTVTFTATDAFGASDSKSATIFVNRLPEFGCESLATAHLGVPFVFSLNVSDPDNDTVTVTSLSPLPGNMTINAAGNVLNWVPQASDLAQNPYNLTFRADDGVGGVTDKTVTIIINSPPAFDCASSAVAVAGSPFSFEVTASDVDGDNVFIAPVSPGTMPAGMTFSGTTLSWSPTEAAAAGSPYLIPFQAADTKGGTSVFILTIYVNRIPAIISASSAMAIVGEPFTHTISATDPDGDSVVFSTPTALLSGMTLSGATFSWTPTSAEVSQMPMIITFVADDQRGGVTSQLFTLSLDRKPVITSASSAAVTALETLNFTVTATDEDSEAVTITASSMPTGMTLTGNVLNWTPAMGAEGSYPITLTATDTRGAYSTQLFTITVNPHVNTAPYFTSEPSVEVLVGNPMNYTVGVTDDEGDDVTITSSSLPYGMTFSGNVLSWTPTAADKALSPVTITFEATDEHGLTESFSLTITINSPPSGGGGGGGGCFLEAIGGSMWR